METFSSLLAGIVLFEWIRNYCSDCLPFNTRGCTCRRSQRTHSCELPENPGGGIPKEVLQWSYVHSRHPRDVKTTHVHNCYRNTRKDLLRSINIVATTTAAAMTATITTSRHAQPKNYLKEVKPIGGHRTGKLKTAGTETQTLTAAVGGHARPYTRVRTDVSADKGTPI